MAWSNGFGNHQIPMSLLEILSVNYHSKDSEKPHSKKKHQNFLLSSSFHIDASTPFTQIA